MTSEDHPTEPPTEEVERLDPDACVRIYNIFRRHAREPETNDSTRQD